MPTQTTTQTDFRTYYELETYLFDTVSRRFSEQQTLSAFDFFCIVIWKANRAKSRIAARLLAHENYRDLDTAVRSLTTEIAATPTPKEKLRVLWSGWGLLIPTASAILTVLYPNDFTVYDVRVCNVLQNFHWLANTSVFETLWHGYMEYVAAVRQTVPADLSLRDKDRWLWGKSFFEDLQQDIATAFTRTFQ